MSGSGLESLSISPISLQWLQCSNFRLTPAPLKSDLSWKVLLGQKNPTAFLKSKKNEKYQNSESEVPETVNFFALQLRCTYENSTVYTWVRGSGSEADPLASIKQNMFHPCISSWTLEKITVNTDRIGTKHENTSLVVDKLLSWVTSALLAL